MDVSMCKKATARANTVQLRRTKLLSCVSPEWGSHDGGGAEGRKTPPYGPFALCAILLCYGWPDAGFSLIDVLTIRIFQCMCPSIHLAVDGVVGRSLAPLRLA